MEMGNGDIAKATLQYVDFSQSVVPVLYNLVQKAVQIPAVIPSLVDELQRYKYLIEKKAA